MPSNLYGPIITEGDVRHAAEETLTLWMPSYLGEVAAQHGLTRGDLPDIRSWTMAPVFEEWPEAQLPSVVVVTPGTNEAAEWHNKMMTVAWTIGVAIVVSAKDREATGDLIGYYAAAARALMIHKGSLGGFATETHFMAERYDDHPLPEQERTLRTGVVTFSVIVPNMNSRYGGLAVPGDPTVDPGESPIITHVDEVVQPQ